MKPDTGRAGVIVAGGRSTRFAGADKATASLDGVPMIRRVADAVEPAVDHLVVNCRRRQRATLEDALAGFDVTFAEDPILDRGPVAGIRTGLRATGAEYAVVVACDMPLVPTSVVDFLFARAKHRSGAVATFDGVVQPLPAVLHARAATTACTEAITRRDGRLADVLDVLEPYEVPERDVLAYTRPEAFHNVDTRADLRAANERV